MSWARNATPEQSSGVGAQDHDQTIPGVAFSDMDYELLKSRVLSHYEFNELYKVHGHMPSMKLLRAQPDNDFFMDRIRQLDAVLLERVQRICSRLQNAGSQHRQIWCRISLLGGLGQFMRLGIIADIWIHILVYIAYTICVQFYVCQLGWNMRWSAMNQDSIYYPGLVLAFLLSFRASDAMLRYQAGCQHCFEMERTLRDLAFSVITGLTVEETQEEKDELLKKKVVPPFVKRSYFKHEFRRLVQLLFACAARDLIDAEPGAQGCEHDVECLATEVERAAIRVTSSGYGHVFRVYLVAAWIRRLLDRVSEEKLFDDPIIFKEAENILRQFTSSWFHARQVAYARMPEPIIHMLWLLTNMMALVLPWEYVSVLRWYTWPISICIVVSFFGILRISSALENPFGFDEDDIPIWDVAAHLDEEICLIMFYSALNKVGGENLYRSMVSLEHVYKQAGPSLKCGFEIMQDGRPASDSRSRHAQMHLV